MYRVSLPPTFSCTLCSLVAMSGVGCTESTKDEAPLIRSVRYVVVKKTEEKGERTFSGALEAGNQSQLSFQVSGRIRKLTAKTGQRVRAGQVIAEIDPADITLQLREAKANAAQARSQANNAEANYRRVRRLYETRNTSRQDLDAARTERDMASSARAGAADTVARIQRQLEYTILKAPADGQINNSMAEVNEVVSAGQPIVVLQAGKALEASIDVPEAFVRLIRIGDSAKVRIGALNTTVDGVIQEIGVSAQGTGVFPIMVKLSSDPEGARPGMVSEVTITPEEGAMPPPEGFRLPLTAVGEDREGRYVFRVEGEPGQVGKVMRQAVETGQLTADGIYLTQGIEEGQRIVTAGVSRIQDGLEIRIPATPNEGGAI